MHRSLFPRDVFAELDRLQHEMQQALDTSPTIRGFGRGGFPALNIGGTPESLEILAFAPGLDPATLDVSLDRGILTIAGERTSSLPLPDSNAALHINERFAGSFRRVLSLSDDADPEGVTASYRDGVLHLSIRRRQSTQPRRIPIG
jgi:HSP20 family protein